VASLGAGDLASAVSLPIAVGQTTAWVQATFEQPTTLSALTLGVRERADVEVQASDDGQAFRTLTRAPADRTETTAPQQTYAFAPTTAKLFRVVLTATPPKPPLPDLPAFVSGPGRPPRPSPSPAWTSRPVRG